MTTNQAVKPAHKLVASLLEMHVSDDADDVRFTWGKLMLEGEQRRNYELGRYPKSAIHDGDSESVTHVWVLSRCYVFTGFSLSDKSKVVTVSGKEYLEVPFSANDLEGLFQPDNRLTR